MATPSLLPEEKPKQMKQAETIPSPEPTQAPVVEVPSQAVEIPETAPETSMEAQQETAQAPEEIPPLKTPKELSRQAASSRAPVKDRLSREIEAVLEEDLTDLFLNLPEDKKKEFQEKGEETASKIRALVQKSKINARKIFSLIRDWLKIIPGVNKFFLEQEAKIKTDKVILMTQEEQKRRSDELL